MHRVALTCALLLTACGTDAAVVPEPPPAPPAQAPPASGGPIVLQPGEPAGSAGDAAWDAARTDGDQAVLVSFIGGAPGTGPCQVEYRGTADVADGRMVVSVQPVPGRPEQETCNAVGYTRTVRVPLPEPLAGRPVVDARNGRPGPLLDGGALLHLAALPEGYTPLRESGGHGPGWEQVWARGDDGPHLDVAHRVDRGEPLVSFGTQVGEAQVRGTTAAVVDDGTRRWVTWRERGAVVTVLSGLQQGADVTTLLTADELVALAQGAR